MTLTLRDRITDLTLEEDRMNPTTPSVREIVESPIEIGQVPGGTLEAWGIWQCKE